MEATYNNIRIKYDLFGQGPVVLFISDNQQENRLFGPLAGPLIAAEFKVLLVEVDSRGREEAASAAVISLLDSLGIGRAALCGLKQGLLYNRLMQNYPQRIACTFEAATPGSESGNLDATDDIARANQQLLDHLLTHAPRRGVRQPPLMRAS